MGGAKGAPAPEKKSYTVAQDQIWKDHVESEKEATHRWPRRWGFLTTSLEELTKDDVGHKKQSVPMKMPDHLQVRVVSPLEKYIKVQPSPAIPQTSTGLIGWRSAVPGLELERYNLKRHVKGSFCKQMKWPEGVD